jgi:hypothetical protein
MSRAASFAVFGSQARGTADEKSDFDVIAVVRDVSSVNKVSLVAEVSSRLGVEVGLSIYTENRLSALWDAGSPFAWHLHLQSRPVLGASPNYFRWPPPAPYAAAASDCSLMHGVLRSSRSRIFARVVGSDCYEAGLLYVCARNIGMFASRELLGSFDFSRCAPYSLPSGSQLDLDMGLYEILVACRHATTRGRAVPFVDAESLRLAADRICGWSERVQAGLR